MLLDQQTCSDDRLPKITDFFVVVTTRMQHKRNPTAPGAEERRKVYFSTFNATERSAEGMRDASLLGLQKLAVLTHSLLLTSYDALSPFPVT